MDFKIYFSKYVVSMISNPLLYIYAKSDGYSTICLGVDEKHFERICCLECGNFINDKCINKIRCKCLDLDLESDLDSVLDSDSDSDPGCECCKDLLWEFPMEYCGVISKI